MTDLSRLKAVAEVIQDEQGNKFVKVPLQVWQEEIDLPNTSIMPEEQHQAIAKFLSEDVPEPGDDEWWEEFREFMRKNRAVYSENDLELMRLNGSL